MKNFYFIVTFLFTTSTFVQAQSVFPTYEQRPVWCIKETAFGRPQPEYTIELRADTVICGKKYNPVWIKNYPVEAGQTESSVSGYIRQEGKKVYQLFIDCQTERLLYDFSLVVGDTVKHSIFDEIGIVSQIDTEAINGIDRKIMIIDYPRNPNSPFPVQPAKRFWIEGIGSSFNPDGGLDCLGSVCEYNSAVVCLSTNNGVLMGACTAACGITTATNDVQNISLPFNLLINPIKVGGFVKFNYNTVNAFRGNVYAMNNFGQLLFTSKINLTTSEGVLDLLWSPSVPGIYWLVIKSDKGERQTLQLIAQ